MEATSSSPVAQQSPAHPSESGNTRGGDGAASGSIVSAAGRASGRELGALAGNMIREIPRGVIVRKIGHTDPFACHCGAEAAIVIMAGRRTPDIRLPLCQTCAQDLLMELAEAIGVGRRSVAVSS